MSDSKAEERRRRRKWDVIDPTLAVKPIEDTPQAHAAALAASKINAILAQKGLKKDAFSAEIQINDCPPELRYYLTKGTTHEDIHRKSGAVVITRGRYKPPSDTSPDKPLYLHISADNPEAVKLAEEQIKKLMERPDSRALFTTKVMIGLEGSDPAFNLVGKVIGPKGKYVKHIVNESGAKVQLRGKGSGFLEGPSKVESPEAMHLFISTTTQKSLDLAKRNAESLVTHVQQEYNRFLQGHSTHPQFPLYYPYPAPHGQTQPYVQAMAYPPYQPVPGYTTPIYPYAQPFYGPPYTYYPPGYQAPDTSDVPPVSSEPTESLVETRKRRFKEFVSEGTQTLGSEPRTEGLKDEDLMPPPPLPQGVKKRIRSSVSYDESDLEPPPKKTKVDHGTKLVDYDDDTGSPSSSPKLDKKTGALPFWAAPSTKPQPVSSNAATTPSGPSKSDSSGTSKRDQESIEKLQKEVFSSLDL